MADHAHNLRAEPGQGRPFGVITRGTTGFNRLRRSDRWTIHHPRVRELLADAAHPLAVDVGYGASHATTVEWATRLRTVRPDIEVVGLEIDPDRVLPPRDGVRFQLGGFELAGYRPHLVRAFNVLRQYDVDQVAQVWSTVCGHLAPGGLFVEGTCDELGRRATWVLLDAAGPVSLTLAWDPFDVERPSDVAERLPKALIHRNVPGEPVHALLAAAGRVGRDSTSERRFSARSVQLTVSRAALDRIEGRTEEVPKTIRDASFSESRFFSVRENSGVYQGIYALLMARGARDWRTSQPFDRWTFPELQPGFHRVFPAEWCRDNAIEPVVADSVLNRTPMGKRTEVVIDGYSPTQYLTRVQTKSLLDDAEFDTVLGTHELNVDLLQQSDFPNFLRDRRSRFVGMVEYAMGKPVVRDVDDRDYGAGDEGPDAFRE